MKTSKKIIYSSFIIVIFTIISSCYANEKMYYGEERVAEIKKIKRNNEFTYIDYKLPKPTLEKVREYIDENIQYTFRAKSFKNEEAVFALAASSRMNYGTLKMIKDGKLIEMDSTFRRGGGFIYLKLDPVIKGHYEIHGWGCRYGKVIDIFIK